MKRQLDMASMAAPGMGVLAIGDKQVFRDGIDTPKVLPFGTPQEAKDHVRRQVDILGKDGGFVLNTVHNIQANVPIESIVVMIETTTCCEGYNYDNQ